MKAERAKQIWKTTDYSEIKAHYLNRKIKRPHVNRLKEQVKLKDLGASVPIVLNQDNVIIDGHHRFVMRKELGLPIYYVNDHNLEEKDIIMLNVNRSDWTTLEAGRFFTDLYKETGEEQYEDYPKWDTFYTTYVKNNSLSPTVALGLLTDTKGSNPTEPFQDGVFKVPDYDTACKIAEFLNKCFRHTNGKANEKISRALWFIWWVEKFNSDKFVRLLERKESKFKNLPLLNTIPWWVKFFQDEILDYSTMTEWQKFNRVSTQWLTFVYDKYIQQSRIRQVYEPSSKEIKVDIE